MDWIAENADSIGVIVALIWNLFLQKTKAKR